VKSKLFGKLKCDTQTKGEEQLTNAMKHFTHFRIGSTTLQARFEGMKFMQITSLHSARILLLLPSFGVFFPAI
jgi:hypothetical protein